MPRVSALRAHARRSRPERNPRFLNGNAACSHAPLCSGWMPELFAALSFPRVQPLERNPCGFSNRWTFPGRIFQSSDKRTTPFSDAWKPRTPTMFQVSFSPCSANFTRRKPSLQTRPPQMPPGNSPRVSAYVRNVRAICLHRRQEPALRMATAGRPAGALASSAFQNHPKTPSARDARPKESRALGGRHRASKAVTLPACLKTGCGRNMLASSIGKVGHLRSMFRLAAAVP